MSKKIKLSEMIERSKKIHGEKYDYSLCDKDGMYKKNKIICKKCGNVFDMTFAAHINQKQGCKFCTHRSYSYSTDEFIRKAIQVHGDKYDYSKVNYINNRTKVCIICQEHGEFWQSPYKHLLGQGCPKCNKTNKLTSEEFIRKAKEIHGSEYDYSNVKYLNTDKKVCIICPEHGEFWQTPHSHLYGQGCPKCNCEKNLNEIKLFNFLSKELKCEVISQYKEKWLEGQTIDIFIPDYNVGIEYQGIQHFKPVKYFGGISKFNYTTKMDKLKKEKCDKNGVKLFYFSSEKIKPNDYIDNIYSNNNEILNEIIKYANNK